MEWEKIFENNATDKGLMSKIHKHKQLIQPNRKMGENLKSFPNKTYRWSQAQEKVLNITNYERNANQSYNEVSFCTNQNGDH